MNDPSAEDMLSSLKSDDCCPRCKEPVYPSEQPPRMQPKARWLLLSCIPINLIWLGALVLYLVFAVLPGNDNIVIKRVSAKGIALVFIICFLPTILLVTAAWSKPRLFKVKCRQCGWSEERLKQMPKAHAG